VLLHLKKHGFCFEDDYDMLQLEHLFVESWKTLRLLKDNKKSHPSGSLEGVINSHLFHSPGPSKWLSSLEQCYKKHLCSKPDKVVEVALDEEVKEQQSDAIALDNVDNQPSDNSEPVGEEKAKAKEQEKKKEPDSWRSSLDLRSTTLLPNTPPVI
jgi:hypothetical protein